eukprot:6185049-Pleurochrysis_carterae.AAC.1
MLLYWAIDEGGMIGATVAGPCAPSDDHPLELRSLPGNAIRALERPGEQQENAARRRRSSGYVVSSAYIMRRGRLLAVRQPGGL